MLMHTQSAVYKTTITCKNSCFLQTYRQTYQGRHAVVSWRNNKNAKLKLLLSILDYNVPLKEESYSS